MVNCNEACVLQLRNHRYMMSLSDAGWSYGDPHIRTLDGFQYTFNGLGEYTLVETTHGEFKLQGRTAKVRDGNGQETDATVFSAFAARDRDFDTVHVEMTTSRRGRFMHGDYLGLLHETIMFVKYQYYISNNMFKDYPA